MGTTSSLEGKVQNLKDKEFKGPQNANPIANFYYSSIPVFQKNNVKNAYLETGEGFWGTSPKNDSFILVSFKKLENIKSIKVLSNISHPKDKLSPDTTLDVSQNLVKNLEDLASANFRKVGEADANGTISVNEENAVSTVRINFQERSRWIFIDKILIDLQDPLTTKTVL